jgi:hypothetical protein
LTLGYSPLSGSVSFGYPSQDATIAMVVAAIVAVASQPRTSSGSGSGSVNPAMIDRRMARSIIVTITGTATTPFNTALQ